MAGSALGSLVVKLALDYAEYTQGLDRTDQASLKFASNAQRNFDLASRSTKEFFVGLASGALASVGAFVSIGAAINGLSQSIDVLGRLDDMAQKSGSSVENLSRFQQLSVEFNHSFDLMDTAVSKLAKGMAQFDSTTNYTNRALKALGVEARDATGQMRDPSEVMIDIAKRLQNYGDGAGKAALITDLFGKSGAELLPILNDMADNIDRYTGVSAEAAKEAARFQDQLGGLKQKTDELFQSMSSNLVPVLSGIIQKMTDAAKQGGVLSGAMAGMKGVFDNIFGNADAPRETQIASRLSDIRESMDDILERRKSWFASSNYAERDLQNLNREALALQQELVLLQKVQSTKKAEEKPQLEYQGGTEGTNEATAAAKKIEALNDASRKFLETLKVETTAIGASVIQTKLLAAAKQAAITPSKELRVEIMAQAQAWGQLTAFQEETKLQFDALQEREDAFWKTTAAIEDYGNAVDEANESAEFEISLLGKSAIEREIALQQRKAELELKKKILTINEQIANADDRAALTEQATAIGERAQAAAKLQAMAAHTGEEWNRMWGTVEQTGKMAFVQLLGHGTSAMKSIGQAIKASVIDLLFQLTARKWIINIGTSISGALSSGTASASGGGLGSIAGLLQGGQSIFSALSGGMTGGMASAVSGLGSLFGSSAVGAFGAGLGMSTGAAAGAAGAYGAAGMAGIGSALSAGAFVGMLLPPVAIATALTAGFAMLNGDRKIFGVGGFLGAFLFGPLAAFFGKGPKKYGPALLTGDFTGEGFEGEFQQDWKRSVGWFSSAKKRGTIGLGISTEADALFDSLVGATEKIYSDLLTATGDAQRSLDGWSYSIRRQVDTAEQQKQLTIDIANSMGAKLIPELEALRIEGEALTETAARAQVIFKITEAAIDLTGQSFGSVGLAAIGLRSDLVNLLGGITNAGAMLQPYMDNFYSDSERAASGWRILNTEMTNLGIRSLPTTRDAFRALVEAQDLSTASGQQMFAALMALAPVFASLTEQAEQAKAALTLLTTDSFTTLVDYTRYIRLAANAGIGPPPVEVYRPAPSALAAGDTGTTNAGLLEELRQLRAEQQAGDVAIAMNTAAIAKVLSRWEGDGMPDVRDIAA